MAIGQVRIVSYDKSKDVDFSHFKTFKFYKIEVDDELVIKRKDRIEYMMQQIAKEIEARGFSQTDGEADLLINIGVVVADVTQTRETTVQDAPVYMGQRRYHWEAEEIVVREYQEGTATIDFVDKVNNELVWQAVAVGTLKEKDAKGRKNIDKGVKKVFKKFPVAIKP